MFKKLKLKIIMEFLKVFLLKALDKLKVTSMTAWLTVATLFTGAAVAVQTEWFAELVPGTTGEVIITVVLFIAGLFTGKRTTVALAEAKAQRELNKEVRKAEKEAARLAKRNK